MTSVGSNYVCGRPHGADPLPIHLNQTSPLGRRHKWMASNLNMSEALLMTGLFRCVLAHKNGKIYGRIHTRVSKLIKTSPRNKTSLIKNYFFLPPTPYLFLKCVLFC